MKNTHKLGILKGKNLGFLESTRESVGRRLHEHSISTSATLYEEHRKLELTGGQYPKSLLHNLNEH